MVVGHKFNEHFILFTDRQWTCSLNVFSCSLNKYYDSIKLFLLWKKSGDLFNELKVQKNERSMNGKKTVQWTFSRRSMNKKFHNFIKKKIFLLFIEQMSMNKNERSMNLKSKIKNVSFLVSSRKKTVQWTSIEQFLFNERLLNSFFLFIECSMNKNVQWTFIDWCSMNVYWTSDERSMNVFLFIDICSLNKSQTFFSARN